ncbi:MAG: YfhO family protein, partial [Bacteroidota bacterium]
MLNSLLKKHPTAIPISFLVLVILIPYWKLTTMQGFLITDDIFTSDIMNDAFPYRFYLGEVLKSGQLPLWYPPVYGGFPLLARAEAGIAYPLNLLLFGLLPPYTALNLIILLTLIIAAAGMYLYARELEADITAALVAAVSFAYSGFMIAHLKHLSTVNAACWFPLGLYFIERAFRQNESCTFLQKSKPFLYLSLVFAVQNLAGHTQTAYYCGLAYVAYFLFRYFVSRKRPEAGKRKRAQHEATVPVGFFRDPRTIWFAVAMLIAAGISAIQLLPTYELVSLSQRSGGVTFEYASSYAYDPSNIKTFFYPYANGDIGNATYRGESIFWEDYGYVGLLTMLLALYAAVRLWKKPHVKFFAVAAIVAYVFVLGPNTPVYEAVFHVVPGMKFFRFPTRFLLIV